MKSINNGKAVNMNEVKKYGLNAAAKDFSEGDETLEKLLLKLWDLGLSTRACCRGSASENHKSSEPYVSIDITPETKDFVIKLIKYINISTDAYKPDISYSNSKIKFDDGEVVHINCVTFSRTLLRTVNSYRVFECISNSIDDLLQNKTISRTKADSTIELINRFSDKILENKMYGSTRIVITHKQKSQYAKWKNGYSMMKNLTQKQYAEFLEQISDSMETINTTI